MSVRNHLAHRFFWANSVPFNTRKGCVAMRRELEAAVVQFEDAAVLVTALNHDWMTQHGVDEAAVFALMDELVIAHQAKT